MEGVPEDGRRWLEFDREIDGGGLSLERMEDGIMIDYSDAPKDDWSWLPRHGMWKTGVSMFRLHSMIYPMYSTETYCLGRMMNTFAKMAEMFEKSEVVDERFFAVWVEPDPGFYFSALLSNDSVIMMRTPHYNLQSGTHTVVYRFHRDRPLDKTPKFHFSTRSECSFCSWRKMQCECSEAMKVSRSIAERPYGTDSLHTKNRISAWAWDCIRHLLTSTTPNTFRITMDGTELNHLLNFEQQLCVPAEVISFSMKLNCATNPAALNQMKALYIQRILRRLSHPCTQIKDANKRLEVEQPGLRKFVRENGKAKSSQEKQTCDICQAQFCRRYDLKRHKSAVHRSMLAVTREKPTCDICKGQFCRNHDLQRHVRAVHRSTKEHICKLCNKAFAAKHYLNSHVTFVHEKKRTATCPICNASFQNPTKLRRHERSVHLHT